MPKPRKMLGSADSPYILSLMRLIETQSKPTIVRWCVEYAQENILPIYEKAVPGDGRPRSALAAARGWLDGKIKLPAAKPFIQDVTTAAKQAEANPVAQAAARAIGQAAATIQMPTHSLGLAFYAAAAVAYNRVGLHETPQVYDQIAEEECAKIEAALRAIAVEDEPNPAKINWYC